MLPSIIVSDRVYQLLAHGGWFSPGTPGSSTTKTDRYDIDEILLKVALKKTKSINQSYSVGSFFWEMKCHPVCPFSIARVRVDDETLGSALNSGGESVGASNGRRQIFKIAFQFVAVCAC